ncbi:AI-2E family transporter [Thermodesulfobacteriota bacterium]
MREERNTSIAAQFLLTAACFVIVVAGMKMASSILVPFLLAAFIAIICAPFLFWMQKRGVPSGISALFLLIAIVAIGFLLAIFVGKSVNDFSAALPGYQERLTGMTAALISWLRGLGFEISNQVVTEYFDPRKIMNLLAKTASGLSGLLTNTFLIILTVIFILLEAAGFPKKLQTALNAADGSFGGLSKFTENVNRYLAIKTGFSLLTGISIWIWLAILGVDHALLWGLLAFLLNYVPNIGSIIAAVPAVLLCLIQLGTSSALLAGIGYVVVNVVVGSILEPKFMGRGLGLSTLVVFLSLVFWGWVLGPVGMVLSVPLTMILKVSLESNEDTRWIAVLLGQASTADAGPNVTEEKDE